MGGLAKTNDFMLDTATVMIGPQDDLYDLTPAAHSIGLVKNFTLTADPAYTDLTQGVKNTLVYSVLTSNEVRATMEAYEYTAQNIAYGLGLATTHAAKSATTDASLVDLAITGGVGVDVNVTTGEGTKFTVGDSILIQIDTEDDFIIREVVSISTDTLTVDQAFTNDVPLGSKIFIVHSLDVGSKADQTFFAAKITGKLVDGTPIVVLIPKVRIVNGFNLAFTADDYANMPFEFTVYDMVSTDTHYADFASQSAKIFKQ